MSCLRRGPVPTSAGRSASKHAAQGGFTLLEVMCAFMVLAVVMVFVSINHHQSMETATYAIDQRDLREVADTIFRRILYEPQKHDDGNSGSLDGDIYGGWAKLPSNVRDRYAIYSYELSKKAQTAAGTPDDDGEAEAIFGDEEADDQPADDGEPAEDEQPGVKLVKITLRIYRTDEPGGEPLITLQRFMRPAEGDE